MQERPPALVSHLWKRRDSQRAPRLLLGELTHRVGGEFAAPIRTISSATLAQTDEVNTGSIGVVAASTQPLRRLTPTSGLRTCPLSSASLMTARAVETGPQTSALAESGT